MWPIVKRSMLIMTGSLGLDPFLLQMPKAKTKTHRGRTTSISARESGYETDLHNSSVSRQIACKTPQCNARPSVPATSSTANEMVVATLPKLLEQVNQFSRKLAVLENKRIITGKTDTSSRNTTPNTATSACSSHVQSLQVLVENEVAAGVPSASNGSKRVAALGKVAGELVSHSLAPSTRLAYNKSWTNFAAFARSIGHSPLPSTDKLIALYVAHLSSTLKHSSIASALSAIVFYHKLQAYPDPTNSFLVHKLLQGLSKVNPSGDTRNPITLPLLHKLLAAVSRVSTSAYESSLFRAMFVLMFHGFLRIGEVTDSPHNLNHDSVTVTGAISITFHTFKHSSGSPFTLSIPCARGCWCPVRLLSDYCKTRLKTGGPFFCHTDGSPITQSQFRAFLKLAVVAISPSPTHITPHSFRIGAATYAAAQGYSATQIQAMGRWHSSAVEKYIRIRSFSITQ